MANEQSVNIRWSCTKGFKAFTLNRTYTTDFNGIQGGTSTQEIGLTQEIISIAPGILTPGIAWFNNLDEDNYIEIGPTHLGVFIPFLKAYPGEPQIMRLADIVDEYGVINLYARAHTAPAVLEFCVLED